MKQDQWAIYSNHVTGSTCGVSIAQRSVETHVCQLTPSHVLLFGGDVGKYDPLLGVFQATLSGEAEHVVLAPLWETEHPQHTVGHVHQNLQPEVHRAGIQFVQLENNKFRALEIPFDLFL